MSHSAIFGSGLRSSISRWRMGILSIVRLISRISQGNGLRSFTPPSLPTRTKANPFGRNSVRSVDFAEGSVSVMIKISRSATASFSAAKRSICSINAGSSGLSAKTIKGRARHLKSAKTTSVASMGKLGWAFQLSTGFAAPVVAANITKLTKSFFNPSILRPLYIGMKPFGSKGGILNFNPAWPKGGLIT